MKKLFFALGTILISLCASTTAYAGSINSDESSLLSAAESTYQYNGMDYKVSPSAISQLRSYLMQDSVDLTSEQCSKALGSISGNIEKGVQGGYLVPVGGQSNQGSSGTDSGNSSSNQGNSGQSTGNDGSGSSSAGTGSSSDNSTTNNPGTGNNTNPTVIPGNSDTNQNGNSTDTNVDSDNSNAQSGNDTDEFIEDMIIGNDKADKNSSGQVSDNDLSSAEDLTADSNEAITSDSNNGSESSIIKDTGFDFSATLAVVIVMGVIMLAGILVTFKYKLFAQYDE